MGAFDCGRRKRPPLSPALRRQLEAVEPSLDDGFEYRPCEVTLVDGSVKSHVYVQSSIPYFEMWGVDPEDDEGKSLVSVDDIAEIRSSPHRLPAALATKLYRSPESGMGWRVFTLHFIGGDALLCLTGNAVDFLAWPEGITPADVADVESRGGRQADAVVQGAHYAWALYEDEP